MRTRDPFIRINGAVAVEVAEHTAVPDHLAALIDLAEGPLDDELAAAGDEVRRRQHELNHAGNGPLTSSSSALAAGCAKTGSRSLGSSS